MSTRATTSRSVARPSLLTAAVTAGVASLGSLVGYLTLVTGLGLLPRRRSGRTADGSIRRFAIMVPAHDEEAVIAQVVRSVQAMHYPHDRVELHVVADHCTDQTAEIVERLGAEVHVRTDPDEPGKGPALNWLHARLMDRDFDAFVIIDADTTVDPHFLGAMNIAFSKGARAAQGRYGVQLGDGSPATALRFAALACRHHLRPLGRSRLGGSCGLFGNGMVFDAELLRDRRWSGHLTEDIEFQMDLLLDGQIVTYVPDAVLQAEMPATLESSVTQNERWELGRIQMVKRYVPVLVRRLVRRHAPSRIPQIDAVLDQLVPPLSVLVCAQTVVQLAAVIQRLGGRQRLRRVNVIGASVSSALLVGHVFAGLASVRAPAAVYRSLLSAPRLVVWKMRLWTRVLRRPDDVGWTRTPRNEEVPA